MYILCSSLFFFQAEDGIRDLVRSRGLGDVYKRQAINSVFADRTCGTLACVTSAGQGTFYFNADQSLFLSLIHI